MKAKKLFFMVAASAVLGAPAALFTSCSSADDQIAEATQSEEESTLTTDDIDLDNVDFPGFGDIRYMDKEGNTLTEMQAEQQGTKASVLKSEKWTNGQTIYIKFLNGNSTQQAKAKKYIAEWGQYVNLKFVYVGSNAKSHIAIAFKWNGDSSSWSYIGKTGYQNWQKPTINFGWLTTSTKEKEWSRVVLHEFGHALGMVHENQQPNSNIKWNKSLVYWYYKVSDGWSQSEVDAQVFNKYSKSECNSTSFDKKSIMTYSISFWMTKNWYSQSTVYYLSSTDKSFMKSQYPGK